jgi:hypothetical protein
VALDAYTERESEGTLHANSLFQLVVESWARGKNELEVIVHETTRESRTNRHAMHNVLRPIKQFVDRRLRDRAGITSITWRE